MLSKIIIAIKALFSFGWIPMIQLLIYQVKKKTGLIRILTPLKSGYPDVSTGSILGKQQLSFPLKPPSQSDLISWMGNRSVDVVQEANEVLQDRVRYFGGDYHAFSFSEYSTISHWSTFTAPSGEDIKFIWEPARFTWVYTLCRAYLLTGEDKYVRKFITLTDNFARHHPPNHGPHWISAQEIALRLIALIFASNVFANSLEYDTSTKEKHINIIISHARRIPPTLNYSRAQNNNHLITEALGLYLAGVSLPGFPESGKWRNLGWKWLEFAFSHQIAEDGTYIQQSMNYHRLMLQAAVLASSVGGKVGDRFSPLVHERLSKATAWLASQVDPISGKAPNLGHNDGAYIFPFTVSDFTDYRPVCQAAAMSFLHTKVFSDGYYDEFAGWMNLDRNLSTIDLSTVKTEAIQKIISKTNWASIRAVSFQGRPAHADQLHVDLWWKGNNVALDPGTYAYNLPAPWDNSLMGTDVHNTLYIQYSDQMTRAGKFLWLDWLPASIIDQTGKSITAELRQYHKMKINHKRQIQWVNDVCFQVTDTISSSSPSPSRLVLARLQWNLPDYDIEQQTGNFTIHSPFGQYSIQLKFSPENIIQDIYTIRAGQRDDGSLDKEVYGWVSPTYGKKIPCRVIHATVSGTLPYSLITTWNFIE